MVIVDREDIKTEMIELKDENIIKMFNKMYKLNKLTEKIIYGETNNTRPVIFGSITNWKVF